MIADRNPLTIVCLALIVCAPGCRSKETQPASRPPAVERRVVADYSAAPARTRSHGPSTNRIPPLPPIEEESLSVPVPQSLPGTTPPKLLVPPPAPPAELPGAF